MPYANDDFARHNKVYTKKIQELEAQVKELEL